MTSDNNYKFKWYKNVFLMGMILTISSVIIFLNVNNFVLHYDNYYNIIAVLMIMPIGMCLAIREFYH